MYFLMVHFKHTLFFEMFDCFKMLTYYSLSGTGIPIDCSSNSFKVKALCSVFEGGDNASIQPDSDDPTAFTFSFLGGVSANPHNKSFPLNDFGTKISSFQFFNSSMTALTADSKCIVAKKKPQTLVA